MTANRKGKAGFVLMVVMLAVAVAAVLGLSYLSSASIKRACSDNVLQACRARYLAESGLQHGLYLLRTNPQAVLESESPAGPFHADDSGDCYFFFVEQSQESDKFYIVTGEGKVGGITQRCKAKVYCTGGAEIRLKYGVFGEGGSAVLPGSLQMNGDLHINGSLSNMAFISGNVSACGTVTDSMQRISGAKLSGVDPEQSPNIRAADYQRYYVEGVEYFGVQKRTDLLACDDALAGGGALGLNAGGVVIITPRTGQIVDLGQNLKFQGTLVVQGNLSLDAANIELKAASGFPALVVSGKIIVTARTNATIEGLVVCGKGIVHHGSTVSSRTRIEGGLVCTERLYDQNLKGQHVLNHVPDRCRILDVKNPDAAATVEVAAWKD